MPGRVPAVPLGLAPRLVPSEAQVPQEVIVELEKPTTGTARGDRAQEPAQRPKTFARPAGNGSNRLVHGDLHQCLSVNLVMLVGLVIPILDVLRSLADK